MLAEQNTPIRTFRDLVGALIDSGYLIKPVCIIHRPYFTVQGTMLKVGDFKLQVYEYADDLYSQEDLAAAVEEKRFFKNQPGFQENEIHCWSVGQMIILYTESDRGTLRFLVSLLGPPMLGIDRNQLSVNRRQYARSLSG